MKFGNIRAVGQVIATGSLVSNAVTLITGSAQLTGLGFATTGSNTFQGTQTISVGGVTELNVQQSGVTIGNVVTDTHRVTGSIFLSGSIVTTATGSIGTYTTPTSGGTILTAVGSGSATSAQVFTTTNHASFFEANTNSGSIVSRLQSQNASFVGTLTNNTFDIVAGGNVIIRTTGSGLVGINKSTTPNATLDVNGNTIVSGSLTTTGTINGLSIPNDLFAQQFLLMGA